jgi:hypothetical protein
MGPFPGIDESQRRGGTMFEGMLAYTTGALFLIVGLALGAGLLLYAIYYFIFKLK